MKNRKRKILERLRDEIRKRGMSLATEKHYVGWCKRYILFHRFNCEEAMLDEEHIRTFLSYLASHLNVASSTQNQALNALVFLYKNILMYELGDFSNFERARKPKLLPVVLSRDEVSAILSKLSGDKNPLYYLMTGLLYGCGLRLNECLRLRVKDVDLERNQIFVRQGKGKKDRVVPLPALLKQMLEEQIEHTKRVHQIDLKEGYGEVYLPNALERKYPAAAREFGWQYVFPSRKLSIDPRTGKTRRHHVHYSVLIRHIKDAAVCSSVYKKLSTHSFRHSYATHSLENGMNVRTLQQLLGHEDLKTTMIYTHVANVHEQGKESPLDILGERIVRAGKKSRSRSQEEQEEASRLKKFIWTHKYASYLNPLYWIKGGASSAANLAD